jgi:hypothetical protein
MKILDDYLSELNGTGVTVSGGFGIDSLKDKKGPLILQDDQEENEEQEEN